MVAFPSTTFVKLEYLQPTANPYRLTEINSLVGDCIFVSPCSSKSFPACQYDVVEHDLLYFIRASKHESGFPADNNPSFDKSVYNMGDGTMAADVSIRGQLLGTRW